MASTVEFDSWQSPYTKGGATRSIAEVMPKAVIGYKHTATVGALSNSLNVSSYTDVGAGDWEVNYSFTWTVATYSIYVSVMADVVSSSVAASSAGIPTNETQSTTVTAFQTGFSRNSGGGVYDSPELAGFAIGE